MTATAAITWTQGWHTAEDVRAVPIVSMNLITLVDIFSESEPSGAQA